MKVRKGGDKDKSPCASSENVYLMQWCSNSYGKKKKKKSWEVKNIFFKYDLKGLICTDIESFTKQTIFMKCIIEYLWDPFLIKANWNQWCCYKWNNNDVEHASLISWQYSPTWGLLNPSRNRRTKLTMHRSHWFH